MATFRNPVGNFTFETLIAFLGALLVFPLLIKVVFGVVRTVFSLRIIRTLLAETILVGLTTLLTREDVLNRLFGQPGRAGSGLLKPDVDQNGR